MAENESNESSTPTVPPPQIEPGAYKSVFGERQDSPGRVRLVAPNTLFAVPPKAEER